MMFGPRKSRFEEKDYLESMRTFQETEEKTSTRERGVSNLIGGSVFMIILILYDYFFRYTRYGTGTEKLIYYGVMIMSMGGAVHVFVGLYDIIKSLWEDDVPTNKRGR